MKTHDYKRFSDTYAQLDIKDTFYLAYRDLPKIITDYVKGKKALDFGCGAGRSTRFLKEQGLDVVGVDISQEQVENARKKDPGGEYIHIQEELPFSDASFDLVLVSLVLMEISSLDEMKTIFEEIHSVLKQEGIVIIITDAEEMYKHETASFSYDFPENKNIQRGKKVKLLFKGTDMIFYDYYWTQEDYEEVFQDTGFKILEIHEPLATGEEPYKWVSETKYPHSAIYALKKQ